MKKVLFFTSLFSFLLSSTGFAAISPNKITDRKNKTLVENREVHLDDNLLSLYKRKNNKKQLLILKKKTLALGGKAVPTLVKVMKSSKFPDKNRWIATFLLGRIMGKKSSNFISKFLRHPNWVLRMASLKTLLALKEDRFSGQYTYSLKDKSLIVRHQALQNIKKLNLRKSAPHVWAMLYDKDNYYVNKKRKKRTNLIKEAIKTVGDLKFKKAEKPLLTMIQKKKYKDIFNEIDYSLSKITGKKSPKGNTAVKRNFWKKYKIASITI